MSLIWDVSPVAFTLEWPGGGWAIRWYGLFFASTFIYGLLLFKVIFRWEHKPEDQVYDLVLYVIAGTLIGARLGFVILYDPLHYLQYPLEILQVWKGGLASHGAVLGILVSIWIYSRQYPSQPFLWVCDRIGMAVPLSGCLIRLGNFFNSEIVGTPSNLPWAVSFLRVDDIPRHPVQLYESFCYLIIFLYQWQVYKRFQGHVPSGRLFGNFLLMVYGVRIVMEHFKPEQARWIPLDIPVTLAQLVSIPVVVAGIFFIKRSRA